MSEFQQVVKQGAKKVFGKIKRGFLLLFAAALVGVGLYLWVCTWTYSDGTRAGTLVKVSTKGVVFKTYEGQLNLGGYQQAAADGVVGNIWDFSVAKREVFQQLQEFEGKQVRLEYKQRYKAMFWQGDTDYFVTKVEVVK